MFAFQGDRKVKNDENCMLENSSSNLSVNHVDNVDRTQNAVSCTNQRDVGWLNAKEDLLRVLNVRTVRTYWYASSLLLCR